MIEVVDRRVREVLRGVKASAMDMDVQEGLGSRRDPAPYLDEPNVEYAILASSFRLVAMLGWSEFATALPSAHNDWLLQNRLNQSLRKAYHPAHTTRRCPRHVAH